MIRSKYIYIYCNWIRIYLVCEHEEDNLLLKLIKRSLTLKLFKTKYMIYFTLHYVKFILVNIGVGHNLWTWPLFALYAWILQVVGIDPSNISCNKNKMRTEIIILTVFLYPLLFRPTIWAQVQIVTQAHLPNGPWYIGPTLMKLFQSQLTIHKSQMTNQCRAEC